MFPIIGGKDLRDSIVDSGVLVFSAPGLGVTSVLSRAREIVHIPWPAKRPYRLFDERAKELGPYYVAFGNHCAVRELDPERALRRNSGPHPIATLQFGLEQHARWKRTGNEQAREQFLAQAQWAAGAQQEAAGVRGSYEFPFPLKRYGCVAGFRSAMAQGEAISLLLRAYQETGSGMFLERAIDASVPLTVDLRDGGVMWQTGDDVIFEGVAGTVPSHVLSGWICALWGALELSRTANLTPISQLYRQSLTTLQKYLPCYDAGTWSYDSLLAVPAGSRRIASLQRHLLHVAQLNVLLSMTKSTQFAAVAARWQRYGASVSGRVQAWVSGLLPALRLSEPMAVPGAKSLV